MGQTAQLQPVEAVVSPAMEDLAQRGVHVFADPVDPQAAGRLLAALKADRGYDAGLFLSEAAFDADPQHRGVNPRPGRNLLERFEADLAFVEQAPQLTAALREALGEGYVRLDRKVVCGVPASALPAWLKARLEGNPVNNLGAYVQPRYRDVTYFYGIDFHQDLIDHQDRDADFLTVYVYLHPVSRADAPLFVLEGSHALGATTFPHDLCRATGGGWRYGDRRGREIAVDQRVLTGPAGQIALWHACTLHGTQPDAADHARLSLRYLFAKAHGARGALDAVNAAVAGPIRLSATRVDLAEDGSARLSGNVVRGAQG